MDPPRVSANFPEDLRAGLVSLLKREGYPASLQQDTIEVACYRYFNLTHRRIRRQPREVLWSRELRARVLSAGAWKTLCRIEEVARSGGDLTLWQSAKVHRQPLYDDRLLIEWGIHHLHLSLDSMGSSRDGGSDELAFVYVTDRELLLIDVRPHPGDVPSTKKALHAQIEALAATGLTRKQAVEEIARTIETGWCDVELLDILDDNWPDSVANMRPPGVVAADGGPETPGMRQLMRLVGINTFTTARSGRVYLPQSGFVADGSNSGVRSLINRLRTAVHDLQVRCRERAAVIAEMIVAAGCPAPQKLKLRLEVTEDQNGLVLTVREQRSGVMVPRRLLFGE